MTEPVRRRKRAANSCTLCRKRKIRCNRETPCSNCLRSKSGACVYETEPAEQRRDVGQYTPLQPRQAGANESRTVAPSVHASSTPGYALQPATASSAHSSFDVEAMKARITELEDKLSEMVSSTGSVYSSAAPSTPAPTRSVETFTSFAGKIDVMQDSRMFGRSNVVSRGIAHKNRVFGQSHWMNGFVVFRDIIEVMEPVLKGRSSTVIASINRAKVLGRAIKSQRSPIWPTPFTRDLPRKDVCDQLIAGYLGTSEMVYRVVHTPSFQRIYDNLWATNEEPSTAFMVMLKLVMAIGTIVHDDKFTMRAEATRWVYEAQTWLSSPVFKSQLGIQYLQTSLLLLLARSFVDIGSELVWISAGAVYRAAVYIGLHKDPSQLTPMSTFEAEMRRRIWNTILDINLQASMESGGPCSISLEDFTTLPPGNYYDEQLASPEPIAHPEHIYTQSSVAITIRKTLPARLAVIKFLNDVSSNGSYEETLRLDTELRAAHKTLRRTLQSYTEDSNILFASQAVDFILQRYITSLHLPYFVSSLQDPLYAFSRKATVDSSLKIWSLTRPSLPEDLFASSETDLARLSRCGAGFFRMYAFHASTFVAAELQARLQEDENATDTTNVHLDTVMRDAADWYLRCIEAGETSLKGYLLLSLLAAQVDATKRRVDESELPALLLQASERAVEKCLPVLESIAGGQDQASSAADGIEGLDFQVSPEFMEDWDLIMSDTSNLGDVGGFAAFLN